MSRRKKNKLSNVGGRLSDEGNTNSGGQSGELSEDPESGPPIPGWRNLWLVPRKLNANTVIALGTIVLGIIGVGGLVLTRESVRDSRQEFNAIQRPLLTLGRKDGVIAEFAVPASNALDQNVGLKLYVQNSGSSAALTPNVQVEFDMVLQGKGQKPMRALPQPGNIPRLERFRNKDGGIESGGSGGPLAPHSERVYFFPDRLTKEEYQSMLRGGRAMMVNGICEYCDELGRYSCRSFMLFYEGPPFNSFYEVDELPCSPAYPPPAQRVAGAHYLFPCEQPAEREKRDKQERAAIVKMLQTETPSSSSLSPKK